MDESSGKRMGLFGCGEPTCNSRATGCGLSRVACSARPTRRPGPACYSASMAEQLLELPTPWGHLAGTLLLPEGEGPWPGVLLVAGAGPTDRDGNNPLLPAPIDNLKRLAQALAAHGIASLRYDKRGLGASIYPGLSEQALRFEHLVDDAVALARPLRAPDKGAGVSPGGPHRGGRGPAFWG